MIQAGVIEPCEHETGEYISPIFSRQKKDGSLRIILNLKALNDNIEYKHFKMDSRNMAAQLMTENCMMASIDLKQAYFLVPMAKEHRKYLKFMWKGQLLQFIALPNGIACAPRLFTKLLKPIYATLRVEGISILGYIDDTFLVAQNKQECEKAVNRVIQLLTELGFVVNLGKSVLEPTARIMFLGYIFDSASMTITLSEDKKTKMKEVCGAVKRGLKHSNTLKIRQVAELLGLMVAYNEGADMGPLHYRGLEQDKITALKLNKGSYDAHMRVSNEGMDDINWWLENVDYVYKTIWQDVPDMEIFSDASLKGWGAKLTNTGISIGGRWTPEEARQHINVLEMQAGFFALKSFCKDLRDTRVLLRMDNQTAVCYVKNMGGVKSPQCNSMAKKIWEWCESKNIWVSVSFIPGVCNSSADECSREFADNKEWMLTKSNFQKLVDLWGEPDIDLFASRINCQISKYCAWKPDPEAIGIDAFTLKWNKFSSFYAFPPFSLVDRCLQKIRREHSQGIIIVPKWPTRPWWTMLIRMLTDHPRVIGKATQTDRQTDRRNSFI